MVLCKQKEVNIMKCIRPNTIIAKIKYIIGLTLAFATLLTYMSAGKTVTTDRVFFEVFPKAHNRINQH